MNEPRKSAQCLTAAPQIHVEHLARGYARASLNPTDRYYMQVRRRLSTLERPIAIASNRRRVWHGYSPYSPEIADKLLAIFRAYYNYHLTGRDKKTPAQRLGLNEETWSLDALLDS